MYKKDIEVLSKRNTLIPATVVIGSEKKKAPLVVFVHGFKAERTEGGRFVTVAEDLAEAMGVNSIMMDFAGCGASKEDFEAYCLSSIIDDIDSCVDYMKQNFVVDDEHLGCVGYSMGGRTVANYVRLHPEFKVMASWAGALFAAYDGKDEFLGCSVSKMKAESERNGYCVYHNGFDNTDIRLSAKFFADMESFDPDMSLRGYEGCALIVQGDRDVTVWPEVSIKGYCALQKSAKREHVMVQGANHGFGLWDNHMEQSKILTDSTARFFKENL